MKKNLTRRELMQVLGAAGLGAAFGSRARPAAAAEPSPEGSGFDGGLIPSSVPPHAPVALAGGKVIQPQRELPVFHQTDVLVVGGGAAGWAAAVAARRAGAKVALIERYGCFGGLWTGGMVLVVIGTHARENGQARKVFRGVGDELLSRLSRLDGAIVKYGPDIPNPTVDPEATKYMMDEMAREAGVSVFFHSWGADAIMDAATVKGAVFESKAGRQAILAKVVIDASGDGDMFAAAGAEFEQRSYAIGTVHRLGNVDRLDREKMKAAGQKLPPLGAATPLQGVTWVNVRGPKGNGLDIEALSRLEMDHRRDIWNRVQQVRRTPGGEPACLLETAPQLGVRITRVLGGAYQLTLKDARDGRKFPDVVAVGGGGGVMQSEWQIPYGALLPRQVDGLLAAGRCISVDARLLDDTRLIAPCLMTGHAAGAAAALAAQTGCRPRDVDIPGLQKLLKEQGAYLG